MNELFGGKLGISMQITEQEKCDEIIFNYSGR